MESFTYPYTHVCHKCHKSNQMLLLISQGLPEKTIIVHLLKQLFIIIFKQTRKCMHSNNSSAFTPLLPLDFNL
jgi:hypothetical protein